MQQYYVKRPRRQSHRSVVIRAAQRLERRIESISWDRQSLAVACVTYAHHPNAAALARVAELVDATLNEALEVLRAAMASDPR